MVRIVSDTSTLYSSAQARAAGFAVSPLSVTIGGDTYKEFDEIDPKQFVARIREGGIPSSSQPALGDVISLYQSLQGQEVLNIAMADGLSGTFQTAQTAAQLCSEEVSVLVMNSRTLCGPHRYLVENAVRLAQKGFSRPAIVRRTEELIKTAKSYLLPSDFAYLRRGGRLSPLVSYVGQAVRLAPVMTPTEDARQLTVAGVKRTYLQAVDFVARAFAAHGVGKGWRIYIVHAEAPEAAGQAQRLLRTVFPSAEIELMPLSPVFIAQGGPGCVAIQTIRL